MKNVKTMFPRVQGAAILCVHVTPSVRGRGEISEGECENSIRRIKIIIEELNSIIKEEWQHNFRRISSGCCFGAAILYVHVTPSADNWLYGENLGKTNVKTRIKTRIRRIELYY